MMRITQRAIVQGSLRGLNTNLAAVDKLQQQLSTGKTISKPSDSPTGTNTAMIARRAMGSNAQYARNIADGKTFLDATDSALQTMLEQVRRVRNLTVQALNDGAQSAQSQQAIATEVAGIRESLLGQANQVVSNRPLFGGVTTGTKAYADDGKYLGVGGAGGIDQPLERRVSDVASVRVDTPGPQAFGDPSGGKDLFSVVARVAADVADPTALTDDLEDLDAAINRMLAAVTDVGTRSASLETAASVNSGQALALKAQLAAAEDIDLPKTIMELQMQQTGYQAALQATAKVIQPTLLDFLS